MKAKASILKYACLVGAVVLLVWLLAFDAGRAPRRTEPKEPLNLILISLDTLRADRLGLYGYGRPTSPALDEFGAGAVVFENSVSVSSWTLPVHVSMLSGRYPTSHGVTSKQSKVGPQTTLLAEILKQQGYDTLASTGGGYVGRGYGFDRGFDSFHQKEKADGEVGFAASVARARNFIESRAKNKPYFIFLHTYDIHCPYAPPKPYLSMFNSEGAEPPDSDKCGKGLQRNGIVTPAQARFISDRYDESIRWVDFNIGRLLDFLKQRDELKRTVIIITSDHGEEFLEHGRIGHRNSLFRELLLVPLLIRAPGYEPRRVSAGVSLIDLFPTVLDLMGLPAARQAQGVSLVPFMRGRRMETGREFQFSELDRGLELRSSFGPARHLIYNMNSKERLLFDLQGDAAEIHNLSDALPREVEQGETALLDFIKRLASGKADAAAPVLDQEELQRLKTLGYL